MAIITDYVEATLDERTNILPPQGPRVRWAGVMSGFFVALGVLIWCPYNDGDTRAGDRRHRAW